MHSKGNHKQDEKNGRNLRMREDICQRSNGQRINLQNIQAAHAAQYQKKKFNKHMSISYPEENHFDQIHTKL